MRLISRGTDRIVIGVDPCGWVRVWDNPVRLCEIGMRTYMDVRSFGEGFQPFESASVFILINALFINNVSSGSLNEAHTGAPCTMAPVNPEDPPTNVPSYSTPPYHGCTNAILPD